MPVKNIHLHPSEFWKGARPKILYINNDPDPNGSRPMPYDKEYKMPVTSIDPSKGPMISWNYPDDHSKKARPWWVRLNIKGILSDRSATDDSGESELVDIFEGGIYGYKIPWISDKTKIQTGDKDNYLGGYRFFVNLNHMLSGLSTTVDSPVLNFYNYTVITKSFNENAVVLSNNQFSIPILSFSERFYDYLKIDVKINAGWYNNGNPIELTSNGSRNTLEIMYYAYPESVEISDLYDVVYDENGKAAPSIKILANMPESWHEPLVDPLVYRIMNVNDNNRNWNNNKDLFKSRDASGSTWGTPLKVGKPLGFPAVGYGTGHDDTGDYIFIDSIDDSDPENPVQLSNSSYELRIPYGAFLNKPNALTAGSTNNFMYVDLMFLPYTYMGEFSRGYDTSAYDDGKNTTITPIWQYKADITIDNIREAQYTFISSGGRNLDDGTVWIKVEQSLDDQGNPTNPNDRGVFDFTSEYLKSYNISLSSEDDLAGLYNDEITESYIKRVFIFPPKENAKYDISLILNYFLPNGDVDLDSYYYYHEEVNIEDLAINRYRIARLDGSASVYMTYNISRTIKRNQNFETYQLAGRKAPTACYGENRWDKFNVSWVIPIPERAPEDWLDQEDKSNIIDEPTVKAQMTNILNLIGGPCYIELPDDYRAKVIVTNEPQIQKNFDSMVIQVSLDLEEVS